MDLTDTLPQIDWSIFNFMNPVTFIVAMCCLMFTIIMASEIIIFIFLKIFEFCETAFNEMDIGSPYFKKVFKRDNN
jgi:hypothetical protein